MATKPKKSTARKNVKVKKAATVSKVKKKINNNKKPKVIAPKAKKAVKINKKKVIKKLAPAKKKLPVKKAKIVIKKQPVKKVKPIEIIKKAKVITTPTKTKKTTKTINPVGLHVVASVSSEQISPYAERPGEEYMNEKQQQHFRHILQQRKKQILEEMNRTMHHLQDEAANFPDPNDRATQEEEFSLELRARDRERKFIKNIDDALQKLNEGEYGYCDACGIEIGIRRLEARPTATLCIDCKTLAEMREKHISG